MSIIINIIIFIIIINIVNSFVGSPFIVSICLRVRHLLFLVTFIHDK